MLSVYSGLCIYIGARLLGLISFILPGTKNLAFWIPFALVCYSFIIFTFLRHSSLGVLWQASSYWIAAFVYLLLTLAAVDILRIALWMSGKTLSPIQNAGLTAAIILFCIMLVALGALNARKIHTVNYDVSLKGQGSNFTIALVSDLHIGHAVNRDWVNWIVDTVNQAEPDMVCITGDIFEGNIDIVRDMPGIITELKRIRAPMGVFACLGNHDVDSFSEGSTARIEGILREAGIILLLDEVVTAGENLYLAGRRDASPIGMMNISRKSAMDLLAGLDADRTLIVLDHQPNEFPQIEKAGADLILAGHTHAGQLFPATLITRAIFNKAGGKYYGYWQGNKTQAVVTSGAGIWGPPIRISTQSEVAVININFVQ
jgi:predicted MPP superfamily phosphohydrolase